MLSRQSSKTDLSRLQDANGFNTGKEEPMLFTIALAILALAAALLVIAATKPDNFRIRRTANIKAAPETIFPLIDDLRKQGSWSPFEKDPMMKRSFAGAERGKGAVYQWEGNNKVGAGRIEITDTAAPSKVIMDLQMFRPFKARNLVAFTIEPRGDSSDVAWTMEGRQPFMAKLMSTVINCDKMVGKEFETGLANLKALAEESAGQAAVQVGQSV